jgi:Na+/proline symporter
MIYMYVILAYLFALIIVALYQARKVKTQADFAVAGRSLSPWILVLTMLATWIGTGSILGNAGRAYSDGISAAILVVSCTLGLILLTFIAPKARSIEKFSVPEIIEARYGHFARVLSVLALLAAYLVIVSYQFNAGAGVIQVVAGKKEPVPLTTDQTVSNYQVKKGYLCYTPAPDFAGDVTLTFDGQKQGAWTTGALNYTLKFMPEENVIPENTNIHEQKIPNTLAAKIGTTAKIRFENFDDFDTYRSAQSPQSGTVVLWEYKLSVRNATIFAAAFIIAFTMIAGLISVAYVDIGNGSLIIMTILIAFPYFLIKAGGFDGMAAKFAAMGRSGNMNFSGLTLFVCINLCLPPFLLILGDANLYQRFFASKSAKGAKQATLVLIFVVSIIELLIIGCGWAAGSLIPDAEEGKYVMIVAAKKLMPTWLGCIMMTNIVAIIMSTADSFLLVPSNSLIRDIYMAYINPKASEKHIIFLSRLFVLCLGIIAFLISLTFEKATGFLERALYAYTIYGTAVTPSLVAALFWKGATKFGAIASIIAGTFVTLTWKPFLGKLADIKDPPQWLSDNLEWANELDEVLPAIAASVLALVVISLLTQKTNSVSQSPAIEE